MIENDEYFSRLCQKLVHVIGAKTADGFVFRVDLRLRPFGDSGPIAMHFDAMEEYYLVQGREWERYAMIKARSLTGGGEGPRLLSALQPFVYRRYLDYGVFDSLRDMKDRISQDVARRGLDADIKLGAGGIREVEFIVQTFQLLRGGRLPELRTPRLLDALSSISSQGLLPREVCRELAAAYAFLRFAEHRIQQYADQQTHRVPSDPEGQNRLAAGMNYPSWDAFHAELEAHKARVHEHFTRLLAAEGATSRATSPQDIGRVWSEGDPERAAAILEANGFAEPAATARVLMDFKKARHIRALGAEGMKLLDRLIPVLFQTASRGRQPDRAVFLALKVIEAIGRRHCYLSLLIENPSALEQLIMLCSQGGWIPELIAKHPILLDDLLNPDTLYAPPDRAELATELDLRFDRLAPEDLESQMDELRHFTQSAILRLAAADLRNILSVSEIGRRLSDLAEIVLGRVLAMAWDYLSLRHGEPPGTEAEGKGFAVVGYGKLGGREMGYTSDLDLVFLHEAKTGEQTQGPKPMDAVLFYTRVGQRIIHILSAQTSAGSLYKVDMRLRPDGASGILVSSLESFFAYQLEQAWTWEHQALVRARAIAGDPRLCSRFEALRRDVLCKRRDPEALREAVQKMRDAILHHLWKKVPGRFLLKYAPGGVTDIEFLVQYLVLAHAHGHPEITKPTGCVAILKAAITAGLLPEDQGEALSRIYLRYLEEIRRRGMRGEALSVPIEAVGTLPEQVLEIWQELIGHPAG